MAVLNVVAYLSTPVTHLTIVLAPGMDSMIANGDLSPMSSSALEVRGFVHVVVNAATDAGNGVSGSKAVQTLVHS